MTLDYTKYNVIATNEGFIGFKEDMINLYKDYVKQLLDDSMWESINEVVDLLIKLGKLEEGDLVYVDYPYKEFNVEIISRDKYY